MNSNYYGLGSRPLTEEELNTINVYYETAEDPSDLNIRNFSLFFTCLYTGLRIQEVLTMKVPDILHEHNLEVKDSFYLQRRNVKGKQRGRNIVINSNLKTILTRYLSHYNLKNNKGYLWFSRQSSGDRFHICQRQALNIFKKLFSACGIYGKVSCHSTRKTYANILYPKLDNDLLALKSCMGHSSIVSTLSYVQANDTKINKALSEVEF